MASALTMVNFLHDVKKAPLDTIIKSFLPSKWINFHSVILENEPRLFRESSILSFIDPGGYCWKATIRSNNFCSQRFILFA